MWSRCRTDVLRVAVALLGLLTGGAAALAVAADDTQRQATALDWQRLPPIPDEVGFAGPFAGTTGGALLVAGGANFPDRKPWEGGTKVWTDGVFVLDGPAGQWRELDDRLPRPLGYGVSVTTPDGVLCIGGSDAGRHYADAFRLSYKDGKLTRTPMPPLPAPCANACGAMVDGVVYVAGGLARPDATETMNTFWALDLTRPPDRQRWEALETWPGAPRMLAAAGARDKSFFLFSGTDLAAGPDGKPLRKPLVDAFRYQRSSGWRRVADLPGPSIAAPSPVAPVGAAHLLVFGGDDGSRTGQPLDPHPGFPADVLAYHTVTNTWTNGGVTPAPYVTTPLVPWQGGFVIPGGEIRPGTRTTEVHLAKPKTGKAAFGLVNLLTLGIYPAVMLGIGLYFAGKKRGANAFFRGGQRIPAWAAGLSIYATMLSSITFMSIPAKAYATDWGFFLNYFSILLLAPVVIAIFLPFFRQLDVTSAYEYLERRFNLPVRLFGCTSFIVFQVARTGIVLFLPALALSTVSNLDINACIIGMGILTILLTVFGGMEAVVWTDVAQSVILLAAAALSLVIIVPNLDGGFAGFVATARGDGKFFENVPWSWDLTIASAFVIFVGQLFTNLISYTSNQEVVQRYLTTRDERKAGRAIWINAWVSVPSGILFFAVGTALYVFYKQHPASLDPALARTDAIFPYFMVREMPAGVAGFVVAGIFAAAQPTSGLNSVATAFVTDFYRRFKPGGATDAGALRVGRIVTVLTGILGVSVALTMVRYPVESLWELFLNVLGLTTGVLAGLFALGMLTRRANGAGAVLALVATGVVLWWVTQHTRLYPLMYGAVSVLTCFIAGYIFSLVLPAGRKSLDGLTVFTRRPRAAESAAETDELPPPVGVDAVTRIGA